VGSPDTDSHARECGMDLGHDRGPIVAVTGTGMPAGGHIGPRRVVEKCLKAASLRQVAAFLIHWLLVRVLDAPLMISGG
jgi:hypothetical protein